MGRYIVKCRDCTKEPIEVKLNFREFDVLKGMAQAVVVCEECKGFKFRVIPSAFSFKMSY